MMEVYPRSSTCDFANDIVTKAPAEVELTFDGSNRK